MNEQEESAWEQGRRTAYLRVMQDCARELGFDDASRNASALGDVELQIRSLWRAMFEDEPFPEGLYLADVLEKIVDEVLAPEVRGDYERTRTEGTRMKNDPIGDRMKSQYESRAKTFLPRRTYTIIRIDGRAFHTYTRGLAKPFCLTLQDHMDRTAEYLCGEVSGTQFGYVQSDEISLIVTDFANIETQAWFDGNVQKMVSVAASAATMQFNSLRVAKTAMFDARVFTVPDPVEVENYLFWRWRDAKRNAVLMAAAGTFSPKQMHGKNISELVQMLASREIEFDEMDEGFRCGRLVTKIECGDGRTKWQASPCFDLSLERNRLSAMIPKYP